MSPKRNKTTHRPRVFVGSSVEGIDVAYAIQDNLRYDAKAIVWSQGVFQISKTAIDSLARTLEKSNFGIFVFTPDDALRLQKIQYAAVRDNVVFELGLFIGKLGVDRTFIVVPDNVDNLRIPTDLTGVIPGTYDGEHDPDDIQSALGPVCNQIRRIIKKLRFAKPVKKKAVGPRSPIRDFVIHSAVYGAGVHQIDVKKAILKELKKGKRVVYVGNQLGGDPTPNTPKVLLIEFSYRDERHKATIPEGRDLVLRD